MSRHPIHFYDSASPSNIPSGVNAAYYVNGYAWSEHDIDRMNHVFGISVLSEAYWAKAARCIDVETGAASPQDVVPFIRERRAHGHFDAIVYVNRSNWDEVKRLVDEAKELHPHYWVSTLDGTMRVADEWATQYQGGGTAPYDLSILHGINNLRPTALWNL